MKSLLLILFMLSFVICNAQPANSWLDSIAGNNKQIKASVQYWNAKAIEFRTGLNPPDPTVEYDYMVGTPASAGNQVDFNVLQSFEFPTVYFKKRLLANKYTEQSAHQLKIQRQDILLEAHLDILELIYLNKRSSELERRLKNIEKLSQGMEIMLKNGEANILQVNKTKLHKIKVETQKRQLLSEKVILIEKLTEMNGGRQVNIPDTFYVAASITLDFEEMEKLIEANDPHLKYLLKLKETGETELSLSKSLRLPKFETGYHSQSILGQSFRGMHVGVSIPLWENRNSVKYEKANVLFHDHQIEQHRVEHYYEVKQLYAKYKSLKESLEEYEGVLIDLNSSELLGKAFQLGEISQSEYLFETSNLYDAYDTYLELEKEYYQSIARLNKFKL